MSTANRDPMLIGLTGYAGTGKDTAAEYLADKHGFHHDSFAAPIKDMLVPFLDGLGIDYAHLFERALKEASLPHVGVSARRLMQTLGTDWARSVMGEDVWVKHAAIRLGLHDLPTTTPVHDRIVISDVRFPNEAQWIEEAGGVIVRVVRVAPPVEAYVSERHIAHLHTTYSLINNGSVEDLHEAIDGLLRSIGI